MGAGASLSPLPSSRQDQSNSPHSPHHPSHPHAHDPHSDGLSLSYRRLQRQGLSDQEIYYHLRETYGSLRLKKRLTLSEGTVRGLALQKLSNTLESHRHPTHSFSDYDDEGGLGIGGISQNEQEKEIKITQESTITSSSSSKPVGKKKKPNLNIIVQDDDPADAKSDSNGALNRVPQNSAMKTPREYARLSPSGAALYIGDFAINEKGIRSNNPISDHHHSFLTAGISDFVMIGKLGRGASGSVVEAIHIPTLTIVALKLLPIRDSEDLHHISSELAVLYQNLAELSLLSDLHDADEYGFSQEMDEENEGNYGSVALNDADRDYILRNGKKETSPHGATVKSTCPQLLAMYDAFLDPVSGVVNLIVEYMDGGSLQDVVDSGGCTDEEILADIAYQVLIGLDFLQNNGHIHRDIKPGNILLSCDGTVKVADFGISKAIDPNGIPQPNSFVGTMCYMVSAPERISNDRYGFPGDIWSLGLSLLAVVKGRFPLYSDDTETLGYWDLFRLICEEEAPVAGDDFSTEFNMFIAACLHKDPSMRPTAAMLMQHPFFLKHANIILRSSAQTQSRTASRSGARPQSHQYDEAILNLLSIDSDGDHTDTHTNILRSPSEEQAHLNQSALSRLTERRVSRASNKNLVAGVTSHFSPTLHSRSGLSPSVASISPAPSTDLNESVISLSEDEEILTAIRLEHLERIMEKVETRYNQYVLMRKRDKEKQQQQGGGSDYHRHPNSSFRSMMSSRSFFKSSKDPLTPVPNLYSLSGQVKWEHFSAQLHLPVEIVKATGSNIISSKFFAK